MAQGLYNGPLNGFGQVIHAAFSGSSLSQGPALVRSGQRIAGADFSLGATARYGADGRAQGRIVARWPTHRLAAQLAAVG